MDPKTIAALRDYQAEAEKVIASNKMHRLGNRDKPATLADVNEAIMDSNQGIVDLIDILIDAED